MLVICKNDFEKDGILFKSGTTYEHYLNVLLHVSHYRGYRYGGHTTNIHLSEYNSQKDAFNNYNDKFTGAKRIDCADYIITSIDVEVSFDYKDFKTNFKKLDKHRNDQIRRILGR